MIIFRRRLIFWILKAYLKKWGKVIALSFILGLGIFFLLISFSKFFLHLLPTRKVTIGIAGTYTAKNLPPVIITKLSRGLTRVDKDGSIHPDIADSWKITNDGKTYEFIIRPSLRFTDGTLVTSKTIIYNFSDVTVERPSDSIIRYTLKDSYSPFLVTVSRPIFKDDYIGVSDYVLEAVDLNGEFIRSLKVSSTGNKLNYETYQFYPTQSALKTAFALGEITQANGLTDDIFNKRNFSAFPHVTVTKHVAYSQLVTLFFNMNDGQLSNKRLRNGLSYALPDTFSMGERTYLPYAPQSQYYNTTLLSKMQDLEHAKLLFESITKTNSTPIPPLTIKTLSKYQPIAMEIQKEWEKAGIKTKIEEVDTIPTLFQIYLGEITVPKDPDQYALWHSNQQNNITRYDSKRIDKLLEDGRKTVNIAERKTHYDDFQKYLLDDAPAAFLFFPYSYVISR